MASIVSAKYSTMGILYFWSLIFRIILILILQIKKIQIWSLKFQKKKKAPPSMGLIWLWSSKHDICYVRFNLVPQK